MTDKDLAAKLAEIAEAAEAEDDRDDDIWVRPAPPRDPSQVYSVRIPVTELEKLRRVADHKGVTPSALMRTWVLLRLDAEFEAMLGICPRCGRPADAAEPLDRFEHLMRTVTTADPRRATDLAIAATAGAGRKAAPRKAAARKATAAKAVAKTAKKAARRDPPG